MKVNGEVLPGNRIPLERMQKENLVEVVLGEGKNS
jgi:hypothetical protein